MSDSRRDLRDFECIFGGISYPMIFPFVGVLMLDYVFYQDDWESEGPEVRQNRCKSKFSDFYVKKNI